MLLLMGAGDKVTSFLGRVFNNRYLAWYTVCTTESINKYIPHYAFEPMLQE